MLKWYFFITLNSYKITNINCNLNANYVIYEEEKKRIILEVIKSI